MIFVICRAGRSIDLDQTFRQHHFNSFCLGVYRHQKRLRKRNKYLVSVWRYHCQQRCSLIQPPRSIRAHRELHIFNDAHCPYSVKHRAADQLADINRLILQPKPLLARNYHIQPRNRFRVRDRVNAGKVQHDPPLILSHR